MEVLDMKIISFANQKGGVAKTTTCVNIAGIFASHGIKTLVVDCDPQCNATSFLFRDDLPQDKTLAAIYEQGLCNDPDLIRTTRIHNLFVISGGFKLAGMVSEVYARLRNHERLHMYLQQYAGDFGLICLDCPPDIGIYTLNAFIASHYVVIPMIPERLSLEGYKQLQEKIKVVQGLGSGVDVLGVIITLFQGGLSVHKEWKRQIEAGFRDKLLGVIHSAADIKRFSEIKSLLVEGEKSTRAYREHLQTAIKIAEKIGVDIQWQKKNEQ